MIEIFLIYIVKKQEHILTWQESFPPAGTPAQSMLFVIVEYD